MPTIDPAPVGMATSPSAVAAIEDMAGALSEEAFARPDIAAAFVTAAEREQARRRVEQYVRDTAWTIAISASAQQRALTDAQASARTKRDDRRRARSRRDVNIATSAAALVVIVIGAAVVAGTYWFDQYSAEQKAVIRSDYRNLPDWLLGMAGLAVVLTVLVVFFALRPWLRSGLTDRQPDAQEEQAYAEWRDRVFEAGVMPRVGIELARLDPSFEATLPPGAESAFVDITEAAQFVETAAGEELRRLRRLMPTANIGISGPRGAGKTALLTRLTDQRFRGDKSGLSVMVQAPTSYDAREFLVDLFAQVCRKVAGAAADVAPVPRSRGTFAGPLPLPARWMALLLAGVGAIVVSGLWPWWPAIGGWVRDTAQLLVGAAGIAAVAAGAILFRRSRAPGPQTDPLVAEAVRHLHSLHYLRTHTAEWAGKASLTVGDVTRRQAVQHAEGISTYPELVRQFRDFLGRVGLDQRTRAGGEVVTTICIDEIDKIGSAADAERFLNDIKVIFGVTNCHYLVSVSEDALATFDRRALSVRTVFDSSFDFVIRMGPLRLTETRQLMYGRLVRIPEPFVALCHVLSGGLPRDLVRTTRRLLDAASAGQRDDLPELASALIRGDVRTVLDGQARLLRQDPDANDDGVLRWLSDTARPGGGSAGLLTQIAVPVPGAGRQAYGTKVFLYYAATLIELFVENTPALTSGLQSGALPPVVDDLAEARAGLVVDPHRSWRLIDDARGRLGLGRSPEPPGGG